MEYSIEDWILDSSEDEQYFRQATHIILTAISTNDYLKPKMIMKGGVLLGIRYQSSRFTTDIDFSSAEKLKNIDQDLFIEEMSESLAEASSELPYGLTCKLQSVKIQPKNPEASFPSFNLTIGYALNSNDGAMKRLRAGQSPRTIKIDYSLNELTYQTDELHLEDGISISAYGFTDLVAEKIRSIIQQRYRKRNRRQDIYDLTILLQDAERIGEVEKFTILDTLIKKSEGKIPEGELTMNTLDADDIKERSRHEYHLLKFEIQGELPNFDDSYDAINKFYHSLPWEHI